MKLQMTLTEWNALKEKHNSEQKKPNSHEEDDIQAAFFLAARVMFPKLGKLLYAIPNGGKRNGREAARLKKQGVTPGVADVHLAISNKQYNCLYIEFKTESGTQSPEQIEFQRQCEESGNKYVICRSASKGIETLKEYLQTTNK